MCLNCEPLIKAIDAYIQKTDESLTDTLADEGYCEAEKTVDIISELEDKIAKALVEETAYILAEAENAADLETFAEDIWLSVKQNDTLKAELAIAFKEQFADFIPKFAGYYLADLDKELKIIKVSERTTAWVEGWSKELANIMQLNSHKEIEHILKKGLEDGIGIPEFSQNIMDSGIRNEYYKARRTAITEVLTAHRAAQQEAFAQSPSIEEKMWRHTGIYIHEPRENHLKMNGKRVPKNERFNLEGADKNIYYPMFPGDTILPPSERIECHCLSQGIVSEKILGLSLEERQRLQQKAIDELDDKWVEELEERNKAKTGYAGY